ncbi:hypothetical protein [Amycolatopsis sp. SID8362]|uniref:hypothetical protein n=1 Tax=Amycolatopsis sp. SID8362 TaxID=2690346 RepID=UPI001EF1C575|nr:hypothetical protein [Amycolatopsis sp. SID8362]
MARQIWVLLGWSSAHGMASTPVGVLGIDADVPEAFVEWVPREHATGRIWRERLAGAGAGELAERIPGWVETAVAPAVHVAPLVVDGALADAVRAQVDDLLGSAR